MVKSSSSNVTDSPLAMASPFSFGMENTVFMTYTCFTFFFIPIFKWNRQYFAVSSCCNTVFSIPKEKERKASIGHKYGNTAITTAFFADNGLYKVKGFLCRIDAANKNHKNTSFCKKIIIFSDSILLRLISMIKYFQINCNGFFRKEGLDMKVAKLVLSAVSLAVAAGMLTLSIIDMFTNEEY